MIRTLLFLCAVACGTTCWSYPLDAVEQTGIQRLEGYRLSQEDKVHGPKLPPGALLPLNQIKLHLQHDTSEKLPKVDIELSKKILDHLGKENKNYSFSLLDLSDPLQPVYAEHRAQVNFNPGSLGKILIAVGIFQALADRYPNDLEARRELLRTRQLVANQFIHSDSHKVPLWKPGQKWMNFREIRVGDSGNLYSWLDWMLSSSSNAAAAMVLREYLLMMRFGDNYPVDPQTEVSFFNKTRKNQLMQQLINSLQEPMRRNGIDPEQLRQGGFFTKAGKKLVPGGGSRANTRSFLTLLLKMEQGRLVDRFSSLELKRLLYMTEKRIRYASHPALDQSAVYFKSGSLYSCQPEEGYVCEKYQGNKGNLLNSIAIIEDLQSEPPLHYLIVVSSNVLKVNSAVAHQTLALRIHRLLQDENRRRLKKKDFAE